MNKLSSAIKEIFTPGTPLCALAYAALGVILATLLLTIGFWRTLLVRYSARTDQLCVLVIVGNPYEESVPKAAEGLARVTDAVRAEIDGVMRELLGALLPQFPCLASYNYQM